MTTRRQITQARLFGIGIMLAAAVGLAGCDSNDGGNGGGDGVPTASFTASPTSVRAGDGNRTVVTLDGSASFDPDGGVMA